MSCFYITFNTLNNHIFSCSSFICSKPSIVSLINSSLYNLIDNIFRSAERRSPIPYSYFPSSFEYSHFSLSFSFCFNRRSKKEHIRKNWYLTHFKSNFKLPTYFISLHKERNRRFIYCFPSKSRC